MNQIYFQELNRYSTSYIINKLGFNEEKTLNILKLLEYYDCVNFDKNTEEYQFNYVGIIIVEDLVIKCYPKYIKNSDDVQFKFKQIIKVIKKYKESIYHEYGNRILSDVSFSLISEMIFFIEDYYKNGVYTNFENTYELNGMGEINWNKSINNNYAIIQNNNPYYIDLFTRKKLYDKYNFFKLLHECIITDCSKKLENVGLLDLFDLTQVHISDLSLNDFGDKSIILNKIENELHIEFNSHKQQLLKTMHSYISQANSFSTNNFLTLYGTNKFYNIWEKICSEVIGNELDTKLKYLTLPNVLHEKYGSGDYELKKIIEKPKWNFYGLKEFKKDTLEPDLITFNLENNEFIILDAKYYNIDVDENSLKGQPGIESITKQYLYQLAYMEFIELNGFTSVKNAFLFPSEENTVNKGFVSLDILHNIPFENDLKLENIQIIFLSANDIFEKFLINDKLDLNDLKLETD